MRRTPVTIVILAWNAWSSTRACLDSLRPTLGVRDQVVVVDNGSTDGTAANLARYPWVEVVANAENHGFAGGCNDGARVARHDVVVFLNNDTVLGGRWIDPLVRPFEEDPAVGATGPRSNFVSGPQVAEGASYLAGDTAGMRRFARAWAESHRGQVEEVGRLVGFCLAVRRQAFDDVGGFDTAYGIGGFEDDDLCCRLTAAGYRLLVAHESFVHHEGHQTFDANGLDWFAEQESNRGRFEARFGDAGAADVRPLVSACLITKDEEENLPECLASLDGLVDEIVIYDTGSSDDTVRLARSLGATVVEGYWDDDFSRARNAALAECRGDWIAWLDADETLVCDDVGALRGLLRHTAPQIDGYSVPIDNLTGAGVGAGFVHTACRLFRRARCEWTGRLHEQIAGRGDHRGIQQAPMELAHLRHTGYLDAVMRDRGKTERNLRVAQAEVDEADGWELGFSLTSLGRSYLSAGRFEEAAATCGRALAHTDNVITRRLALRTQAEALTNLQRYDEALRSVAALRGLAADSAQADAAEAKIRLGLGEPGAALECLDRLDGRRDDEDGFEISAQMFAPMRAEALERLGRVGDAADVLLSALVDHGVLDTHLGTVVDYLQRSGRPLTEIAAVIPATAATHFLAQARQLVPEVADRLLQACLDEMPDRRAVLATAASVAASLPVDRTLWWSAQIRQAGYAASCPLIAVAGASESSVVRARAAATARAAFGDVRAVDAFAAAVAVATPAERQTIATESAALCPELAATVAVSDRSRAGTTNGADEVRAAITEVRAAGATGTSLSIGNGLPGGGAPRVSIVIPCMNRAELTLGCLQSLAAETDAGIYEVVLVDNGSTDATTRLTGLSGPRFRIVRNECNVGFGPACNQGAAASRGELLLFLNNDTVLLPGWLGPLVAALDEDAAVGAVQPKLVYPDGRLNDAGGLVFAGGQPWVYGKGHPEPAAPQFSCRRAPDYASGACLLVRRTAFDDVGGFDDRYAPAYFEDTDLSFALRSRGWKVLYEPASTVVHMEGGTAGTDVGQGLKQHQARNAEVFAAKWEAELAGRAPLDPAAVERWAHRPQGGFGPGEHPAAADRRAWAVACREARRARSVLVVDLFMPVFDRASGGLRQFELVKALRYAGHAVTFYALAGGSRHYADALAPLGVPVFGGDRRAAVGHGPAYVDAVWPSLPALVASRRFDVVVLSPWTVAEAVAAEVRRAAPDAAVVVDTNDVHFVRLQREAAVTGTAPTDVVAEKDRELDVYRRADRIVCVTDQDAAAVRAELPGADIVVVPNAHDLVDTGPGFDDRAGCLFVGNFNHRPNGDAVRWWKDRIGPELAGLLPGVELPDAELTVVGNDPAGEAAALAGPGVVVAGTVPSTVPYLHRARVSVAPLRFGAGMKGKVGEALAAGLPVVATSVAVEGMGLVDGVHVLVADTPADFAQAVARLSRDPDLWRRLREAGRAHVAEHLGLDRMRRAVDELVAPRPTPSLIPTSAPVGAR